MKKKLQAYKITNRDQINEYIDMGLNAREISKLTGAHAQSVAGMMAWRRN